MALPLAVGELAIAVAKSEAASIALKRLGDYVWPKISKAPLAAGNETTLAALAANLDLRPTRSEMESAFDSLEERLAALIDVRAQADLAVTRRWLVALGIAQAIVMIGVIALIFK